MLLIRKTMPMLLVLNKIPRIIGATSIILRIV